MTITEIIKNIKAPKKLSINHWRYNLLHWCFNQPQGEKSEEMPGFMYTHYCPIFHVSNLIAVLIPVIFSIKFNIGLGKHVINGIKTAINTTLPILEKILNPILDKIGDWETEREERKDKIYHYNKMVQRVYDDILISHITWKAEDFEKFYNYFDWSYLYSKEEVKPIYEKYVTIIAAQKTSSAKRKEQFKKRFYWMIDCSNILFKGLFYLGYAAIAIFAVTGTIAAIYYITIGITMLMYWLFTINPIPAMLVVAKIVGTVGSIVFVVYIGRVKGWWSYLGKILIDVFNKTCIPVKTLKGASEEFYNGITSIIANVITFVSVFYGDNCPPVILTDDEGNELS